MSTQEVAAHFYDAFKQLDGDRMVSYYSDEVEFSDPVFPHLKGREAKAMWRMLCQRAKNLKINYWIERSLGNEVWVKWDAVYVFAGTQRKVHNVIYSHLTIVDGKITRHRDQFSFWRWASQALGPVGSLLGWSGPIRRKVQTQAAQSLARFLTSSGR